jgi:DNA-binding NarL/FixJ family response regulator
MPRPLAQVIPENEQIESPKSSGARVARNIVLIEERPFVRDCVARTFKQCSEFNVIPFPSLAGWIEGADTVAASLIVWCVPGLNEPRVQQELELLVQQQKAIPIIVLSDAENLDSITYALNAGARGYLATSVSLEVAMEAIHLVIAGGTYVPASIVFAAHRSWQVPGIQKHLDIFTPRQVAVVEALRRGKANKIIAYELNMRESTVKVHVRSIMKKLKARNRTEVAFLTNSLFNHEAKVSV